MNTRLSPRLSNLNLTCLMLALLCSATSALAQGSPPGLRKQGEEQQRRQAARNVQDDDEDDADEAPARPAAVDPGTVLRKARFVYVHSDSVFVSGSEVEASLLKRKEFKAWGMLITRSKEQADLFIEITRKPLTRRFTFSVIDPRTAEVVASGKTRSVLFGKKIPNKIAEKFANRVKVYRPYP